MPGMIEENGLAAIIRTLEIDNPAPSVTVLAEGGSGQRKDATLAVVNKGMRCNFLVADGPKEAELVFEQGLALLKLPAGKHRIKLAMWDGEPAYPPAVRAAAGKAENLSALMPSSNSLAAFLSLAKRASSPACNSRRTFNSRASGSRERVRRKA